MAGKDPKNWTAAEFNTAISNALHAGDMKFVSDALTLMALVHPREAELVIETMRVGMAMRGDR